jgi:hypothetical protein
MRFVFDAVVLILVDVVIVIVEDSRGTPPLLGQWLGLPV